MKQCHNWKIGTIQQMNHPRVCVVPINGPAIARRTLLKQEFASFRPWFAFQRKNIKLLIFLVKENIKG